MAQYPCCVDEGCACCAVADDGKEVRSGSFFMAIVPRPIHASGLTLPDLLHNHNHNHLNAPEHLASPQCPAALPYLKTCARSSFMRESCFLDMKTITDLTGVPVRTIYCILATWRQTGEIKPAPERKQGHLWALDYGDTRVSCSFPKGTSKCHTVAVPHQHH